MATPRYVDNANDKKLIEERRQAELEKKRVNLMHRSELMARINAATIIIPKPVPSKTVKVTSHDHHWRPTIVGGVNFTVIFSAVF